MSDEIKELVKRLRERAALAATEGNMTATCDARYFSQSADALEAMAGEVERLKETITTAVQFNEGLAAERDRLKAALDIAKDHAKQNQRARDLVSPYPNDHAKRIVWEKALYHDGKDLWNKLRKALGGDA